MSRGRVRVILLCEDAAHESFMLALAPARFQRFLRVEKTGGNAKAELAPRAPPEPVAIIVPSRNIEAWFVAFLKGLTMVTVDELRDDKSDAVCHQKDAARKAGKRFEEWLRDETRVAPDSLPALADARVELRRLPRPS